MKTIDNWTEYKIIKATNGMKLEEWNGVKLFRPDPQIVWNQDIVTNEYDAKYSRSNTGGGSWEIINPQIPNRWVIHYQDLTFNLKLMGFKHTGLFPEQAYNWDYLTEKIKSADKPISVLNLFAYTGAASVVALKAGASVVHVDSAKGMVDWAKENVASSKLEDKPIRYLVDDVVKFVKREIKRGNTYDIILMDPPSFGRGANGEIWDIEQDLFELVSLCTELLSEDAKMFLINSYTTGLSMTVLENILKLTVNQKFKGHISSDELGIPIEDSNLILPCGIYARWER